LALVKWDDRYGFIDPTGSFAIDVEFDDASSFTPEGFAMVKKNGKWGVIDGQEHLVLPCVYEEIRFSRQGFILFREHGLWGFMRPDSSVFVEPIFTNIREFNDNGNEAVVAVIEPAKRGAWSLVDTTGKAVSDETFADVGLFFDRVAPAAAMNKKWGLVNTQGAWVLQPQFAAVENFCPHGFARIHKNELSNGRFSGSGYVNTDGEVVVEPKYTFVSPKSPDGLQAIRTSKGNGFINMKGDVVIEPSFQATGNFSKQGVAPASANGRWGLIDKTGKWVLKPEYDRINDFSASGMAVFEQGGLKGVLAENGEVVVEPLFEDVKISPSGEVVAWPKKNEAAGLLSSEGDTLLEPRYTKLDVAPNGLFYYERRDQKSGKLDSGYLNKHGETVFHFAEVPVIGQVVKDASDKVVWQIDDN
jgi:hypothetical protein